MDYKRALQFRVPSSEYPRYKFFQDYMSQLVERLPRIIDANKLAGCVPYGQSMLKEILDIVALFEDSVMVFLFADADHLKSNRLKVTANMARPQNPDCITKQETTWSSCISDTADISVFHPVFIIIVEEPLENEISPELLEELSKKLTDNQKRNLIICNKDNNKSYQCTDLFDVNFAPRKDSRSFSKLIEEGLETKAVGVLVKILKFIRIIIPRPTEELHQSLLDCINEQLHSYLCNSYVIEDLSPVHRWQCQENHLTHAEKVKYFQQNLTECISKKTRLIICSYILKSFGIPASFVNELLNEVYFDYDNKIHAMLKTAKSLPSWPKNDNVYTVRTKLSRTNFLIALGFVTELENYIKDKVSDMNTMKRLEFEIFGFLKTTKVPLEVDIPHLPKLSQEMQKELLDLSPISGCGIYCGQLTLHLSRELQPSDLQLIQKILSKHNYTHGYVHKKVITFEKEALLKQTSRQLFGSNNFPLSSFAQHTVST